MKTNSPGLLAALAIGESVAVICAAPASTIVGTGQTQCYDNRGEIAAPKASQPFDGQDAQYRGVQPSCQDHGDVTGTDRNPGMMRQGVPPWPQTDPC